MELLNSISYSLSPLNLSQWLPYRSAVYASERGGLPTTFPCSPFIYRMCWMDSSPDWQQCHRLWAHTLLYTCIKTRRVTTRQYYKQKERERETPFFLSCARCWPKLKSTDCIERPSRNMCGKGCEFTCTQTLIPDRKTVRQQANFGQGKVRNILLEPKQFGHVLLHSDSRRMKLYICLFFQSKEFRLKRNDVKTNSDNYSLVKIA